MTTYEEFVYAREQIGEARNRVERVRDRVSDLDGIYDEGSDLGDFDVWLNIANIISDCQVSIETSSKSIFKLVGVEHPRTHDISFEDQRTAGLLNEIPEQFERSDEIPRVIFLTQFWHQFYTMSKYGVPEHNIRPRDIFTEKDAARAVEDAGFCVNVATDLLKFIHEEYDHDMFGDLGV